jgi:hypothetical protein
MDARDQRGDLQGAEGGRLETAAMTRPRKAGNRAGEHIRTCTGFSGARDRHDS